MPLNTGQVYLTKPFGVNHATPVFNLLYDVNQAVRQDNGVDVTGAYRPFYPSDFGSTTISLTGSSFVLNNVAVTGGNINVVGGSIGLTNTLLATSGNSTILNTAPIPVSGVVIIPFTNPIYVTGNFGSASGGTSSVVLTGINQVGITGGTLNVSVTGGVLSASSSSVALTGISPVLAPLPISGAVNASIIGTPTVTVGNALLAVSGVFTANAAALQAISGNTTIINTAPIAISGVVSTAVTVSNVAITGFNSTIAPLAVTGSLTVAAAAITPISGFTVDTVGNQLLSGISGRLTVLVPISGAVNSTILNTAPIAISGVVNTAISVTNVAVTGNVNSIDTLGNLLLSGISGQLAANLAGSAPVTGDIRNIPGTLLGITGTIVIPFTNPVFVTGSFSSTVTNPLGVTGINRDTNVNYNNGTFYTFLPIGGRATAATGAGSATGYASGANVILNINQSNGGLFVSQANLDYTQDTVTVTTSGVFNVAVTGTVNTSLSLANITVTGFPSTIAPLAISGIVTTTVGNIAVTGGQMNIAITGGVITSSNPVGISGVATDVNAIFTGAGKPIYNFVPMGGRAVDPTGRVVPSGYNTGDFVMLSFNRNNGGVMMNQGNLDSTVDSVTSYMASTGVVLNSGVSGLAAPFFGVALGNNPARKSFYIANLSTGILLVNFSTNMPTTGIFNLLLKGATTQFAGDGASYTEAPAIYTGPLAVTGLGGAPVIYNAWQM